MAVSDMYTQLSETQKMKRKHLTNDLTNCLGYMYIRN